MIRSLALALLLTACLSKPEPPDAVALPSTFAVGDNHACAVEPSGALSCWGDNRSGQLGRTDMPLFASPVAVGTETGWTAVAAGRVHTCGIIGTHVRCWGDDQVAQSGGAHGTSTMDLDLGAFVPTRVFAQGYGTCALDGAGHVMCWGEPSIAATTPIAIDPGGQGLAFEQIAVGDDHACALTLDHVAYCWGSNADGQLGAGTPSDAIVAPANAQPRAGTYSALAVGYLSTCGINDARAIECWGNPNTPLFGGLADASSSSSTGAIVDGTHAWDTLSMSGQFACATTGGDLYCYGDGQFGQLGDGFATHPLGATPILTAVSDVRSGDDFACAHGSTGTISCWGQNRFGNIGNGEVAKSLDPQPVGTLQLISGEDVYGITTGGHHACVLTTNGKLWCWGDNREHQIDPDVDDPYFTTPHLVATLAGVAHTFLSVTAGRDHTCALDDAEKDAYCWGNNDSLQTAASTPGNAVGKIAGPWDKISAGTYATCGIFTSQNIYCWGRVPGQTENIPPTEMVTGAYTDLSVGEDHVIATDGEEVIGWGRRCAAVGNGMTGETADSIAADSPLDQTFTTGVTGKINVAAAKQGTDSCALLTVGSTNVLRCWGEDAEGELGTDPNQLCQTPTQRTTLDVQSPSLQNEDANLALAGSHGCVQSPNADLLCWGDNVDGALGAHGQVANDVVDDSAFAKKFAGISLSLTFGCGIAATAPDQAVQCWGTSAYGELGGGTRFVEKPFVVTIP